MMMTIKNPATFAFVLFATLFASSNAEYKCDEGPDGICGYPGNDEGYPAWAEGDHKKGISPWKTINMNFYCNKGWVYSVDIKHEGSDITCAIDKCPAASGDPFIVECTNWSTSHKHIYVDHFKCTNCEVHGECNIRRKLLESTPVSSLRGSASSEERVVEEIVVQAMESEEEDSSDESEDDEDLVDDELIAY